MRKEERVSIDRRLWRSLVSSVREFMGSADAGRKAKWMFVALIFFLGCINALNVVNSYVNRDFMTAIEDRNRPEFIRLAFVYLGFYALITVVAVVYRYTEQRLALLWRQWTTRRWTVDYATDQVYYWLKLGENLANPDQRIADDIRTFTTTTLSFVLILLNCTLTVVAFSGVMWSISPRLFLVSVIYAAAGTFLTFLLGRPLVRLNYHQLDKEANFRSSLIYLRGNAESVALSRREGGLIQLSLRNLEDLVSNFRRIIAIERNVNFFTTGYNWLIQIIPALIVAPLFIEGRVEFGIITQSAIAFAHLVGAFSIIVTQFQSVSSYAAVLARLAAMQEASKTTREARISPAFSRDPGRVAYSGVTLHSPRSGRVLIKNLTLEIPHGKRVLVCGPDETARSALFHATVGLWSLAAGRITRPPLEQILLATELPYLPPGTLRELLLRPWPEENGPWQDSLQRIQAGDQEIVAALDALGISSLLAGFGGFDTRHHWENVLPLDQQQLLVIARILLAAPRFALLDQPSSALNDDQVSMVLRALKERSISYLTFEGEARNHDLDHYDGLLALERGGTWSYEEEGGASAGRRKPPAVS